MDTDLAAAEERLADIDEGKTGVTAKAPIVVAWNAMIEASSDYSTACGKSMTTANPSQSDEGACTSANGTLTTSIASWNDAIGALKGTTPTQDTLAPPTTSAG